MTKRHVWTGSLKQTWEEFNKGFSDQDTYIIRIAESSSDPTLTPFLCKARFSDTALQSRKADYPNPKHLLHADNYDVIGISPSMSEDIIIGFDNADAGFSCQLLPVEACKKLRDLLNEMFPKEE
jgi:hypothetical protein